MSSLQPSGSEPLCAQNFSLTATDAVAADGTRHPAVAGDNRARARDYRLGDTTVTEIVPPSGWTPLKATDQELRMYGFPKRPTSVDGLREWTTAMSAWKSVGTPGMCATTAHSSVTHSTTSNNWAGGMNVNGSSTNPSFYSSEGKWTQPSFDAVCPGNSAYTIWTGLGGWNSGKLLQDGVDNAGMSTNTNYMFWEALAPGHDNLEAAWSNSSVTPGHNVYASTDYYNGTASFFVEDLTTGASHSANLSSYAGLAMSGYFDGTTADFITEAPGGGSAPDGLFYLRKPTSGNTYYWYAATNGNPIADYPSWNFNEVGYGTGNTMQTTTYNGANAWHDYWYNCS